MIEAVLFDMDGVLVDSEQFICEAAIKMFAEYEIEVHPIDFVPFVGTGENRYIGGVAEKYGLNKDVHKLKQRTYEIYAEVVKGKLPPLAGVLDFIKKCREKGLKIAVASSADLVKVKVNLSESGIGENTFDAIANGLDVKNKKPAPDIFLTAAGKLRVNPKNCLVIEDAVSGVKAAKCAGCKCLALMTSFNADELSEADWVVNTLADADHKVLEW
jgi:beta-phosphoglucomutase